MKKILALVACLSLVASLAIGGSIAYLTDRDSEANVFTIGNVEIDLTESFGQGATLIPGVNIEKKPVITNTGDNDAWVWMEFAIPSALDNYVQGTEQGSNENVIHWNPLGATAEGYVTEERVTKAIADGHLPEGITAQEINDNKMTWNVFNSLGEGKNAYQKEINGVQYNVYVLLYNKALEKDETTLPGIFKVFLDAQVDIDPNGDWYKVNAGVAKKLDWNTSTNGDPVIYVSAYGIQTEGFADVNAAYEAYGVQWGNNGSEYGDPTRTVVANADALVEALEDGEDVVFTNDLKINPANMSNAYGTTGINVKNGQTIDGNGHTLDIKGAGGTWDSGINTTGGLIRNLTGTGSFRGIFITHNSEHREPVVLENVIIDGTTYTISCDQGLNQGLTATNSTFNGWTSYAATLGNAKFVNCKFGKGNGYSYMRPYAPTEYVGCEFEAGYTVDPRAAVTFENCTLGGVALTADNLATLVTSTANATVK